MSILDNAVVYGLVAKEVSSAVRAKKKEQRMDHVFNAIELLVNAFRSDDAFMKRVREAVK